MRQAASTTEQPVRSIVYIRRPLVLADLSSRLTADCNVDAVRAALFCELVCCSLRKLVCDRVRNINIHHCR